MVVLAAYGDDHQVCPVHDLLVVGAHVDALEAFGQFGGDMGSPRGEEDFWRRTAIEA